MLVYDLEIEKAIQGLGEEIIPGINYCSGWDDKENMGIACLVAYDYTTDRYRTFTKSNLQDFQVLAEQSTPVVGFNSLRFDDQVCAYAGLTIKTDYDILQEIWKTVGLGPDYVHETHKGYGLDAMVKTNFGLGKTGYGGMAPVWWQQGEYGRVIDYCICDVHLTKRLLDKILRTGQLLNPKGGILKLPRP